MSFFNEHQGISPFSFKYGQQLGSAQPRQVPAHNLSKCFCYLPGPTQESFASQSAKGHRAVYRQLDSEPPATRLGDPK